MASIEKPVVYRKKQKEKLIRLHDIFLISIWEIGNF